LENGRGSVTILILHKRYAELAPKLPGVIKQMKEEGLIEVYGYGRPIFSGKITGGELV